MTFDFFSKLNSSNCTIKGNEYIITSPSIIINGKLVINKSCKITSTCQTIISCTRLKIKSPSVSFSNLFFITSIKIKESDNFSITDCILDHPGIQKAALQISECKNVTINRFTIKNTGKSPGILVLKDSSINANQVTIHDTGTTQVAGFSNSSLIFTNSTFSKSLANGILLDDQSSIEISDSTFSDMECPALFIEKSTCKVIHNKFEKVQQNCISVISCQNFLIEQNEISEVKATAISASEHSQGVVTDNIIHDVEGNGILCIGNSELLIKNNKIYDLQYPSISVASNSKASLFDNKIDNIQYSGIAIRNAKEVTITGSTINNIGESGISVSDSEKCVISKNSIKNCQITSIEGYNKSTVFVNDNIISNMGKYAFLAYTAGFIKAENNQIKDIHTAMAKLAYKGGGDFTNNSIDNCPTQCEIQTSSPYFFKGNGQFKAVTNDPKRKSPDITLEKVIIDNNSDLCLKCHKNKRDYYLLDCSHKVYCQECAELAFKNKEDCPLCRFPIVNISNGFGVKNDDMCIICCDKPANCIILPCGHMGFCSDCIENWFKNNKSCPICRNDPSFYKVIGADISI
ncbi:hypothetical protein M9Y10_007941 [Tritrichomonas musculus]|uniref:RING-type domain-containing protein n=1 Tax=Tritrichomonas musculus TaxID=1915356 RepID=A0ABR2J2R0_9EUKA